MIFNQFLTWFLNVFAYIAHFIIDNILDPFLNYFLSIFPDFSTYMAQASTYLTNYFFNGAKFARDVIINVTGFPLALFQLLVIFFAGKFILMFYLIVVKAVLNGYSLLRTGTSAHKFFGGMSK